MRQSLMCLAIVALACTAYGQKAEPTKLTVEQASTLVQEGKAVLDLDNLTTLDLDVANALAAHGGEVLSLNGLTSLADDAAEALSHFKGRSLRLRGLTTLSNGPLTTKLLRQREPEDLTYITKISVGAARAFVAAKKGKRLALGVTTLDPDAAKALAEHEGFLAFLKLDTLSPEVAQALAHHKGELCLDHVSAIDAATAKALAQHSYESLSLEGLSELTSEAAEAIAGHKGRLYLNGIKTLDTATAKALAQHVGFLSLQSLESVPPEGAAALRARGPKVFMPTMAR